MAPVDMDAYDLRLLAALQEDARLSHVALSQRIHLSASQIARRLQRLEQAGIIRGYSARIDPCALGLGVMAIVAVTLGRHGQDRSRAFHEAVLALPEVLDCWQITGDADYQLRVVVADLKCFSRLLADHIMRLPGVATVRSAIVLDHVKAEARLPVTAATPDVAPPIADPSLATTERRG